MSLFSSATPRSQTFLSSGTFTPSAALIIAGGWVKITAVGGGGGASGGGSCGGGGGSVVVDYRQVTSTPITITIGAGGPGGAIGFDGSDGGTTTFASPIPLVALGGKASLFSAGIGGDSGGSVSTSGGAAAGGGGGAGGAGQPTISGAPGAGGPGLFGFGGGGGAQISGQASPGSNGGGRGGGHNGRGELGRRRRWSAKWRSRWERCGSGRCVPNGLNSGESMTFAILGSDKRTVANVIVADQEFVDAHYPGAIRIDQFSPVPGIGWIF